jgi:hypothetical protein
MDATCLSDGKYITLKRINKSVHPHEVDIGLYFSSGPLISHAANHCVPICEVITLPDDADIVILVMPLLRAFADPYFDTFGEAIDCFHQLFEVSSFHTCITMFSLHPSRDFYSCTDIMLRIGADLPATSSIEISFCNRDCMNRNIVIDPREIYPESFHPMKTMFKRDFNGFARHFTRTQRPPKYYLIDFGLSRKYDPSETNPREIPILGGDKEVPEFKTQTSPVIHSRRTSFTLEI